MFFLTCISEIQTIGSYIMQFQLINMYLWGSINWHCYALQWLKRTPKSYPGPDLPI